LAAASELRGRAFGWYAKAVRLSESPTMYRAKAPVGAMIWHFEDRVRLLGGTR
jgi:hypothetical protein